METAFLEKRSTAPMLFTLMQFVVIINLGYFFHQIKAKSSLSSRYYAEACYEWWDPSSQLSTWAIQKHRSGGELLATLHDLTDPGIGPKTSRADSDVFDHNINFFSLMLN